AEHAHERGIGVDEALVGSDDADAFLQGLEEFGETRFVFAQRGDVAGEHGDAIDFVVAHHGVRDAVEIEDGVLIFEAQLDDAAPDAALEEARHGALDEVEAFAGAFFDEVSELASDDLLERQADQGGEAAIDGADFSIEGHGEENVIEGVDEVAETLLGAGDDFEELIELLVAGGDGFALLDAADESTQLGNFLRALPGVKAEKRDEND